MKQKLFIIPFIYIVIMAFGMTIMHYGFGGQYGDNNMMKTIVFVEVVLTFFTIYSVNKYSTWKESGFNKLSWKGFLLAFPSILILFIYIIQSIGANFGNLSHKTVLILCLNGITITMVAFSEEAMFRGIMLNWSLKKYGVLTSVFISSIGFSLLHSINFLGGENFISLIDQLFSTFLFGLFAALIALKTKNIMPLIIIHFLWDFALFTAQTLNISPEILVYQVIYQYLITLILIILLIIIHLKNKKKLTV